MTTIDSFEYTVSQLGYSSSNATSCGSRPVIGYQPTMKWALGYIQVLLRNVSLTTTYRDQRTQVLVGTVDGIGTPGGWYPTLVAISNSSDDASTLTYYATDSDALSTWRGLITEYRGKDTDHLYALAANDLGFTINCGTLPSSASANGLKLDINVVVGDQTYGILTGKQLTPASDFIDHALVLSIKTGHTLYSANGVLFPGLSSAFNTGISATITRWSGTVTDLTSDCDFSVLTSAGYNALIAREHLGLLGWASAASIAAYSSLVSTGSGGGSSDPTLVARVAALEQSVSNLGSAVNSEQSVRAAADNALQSAINNEASARSAEDVRLQQEIDSIDPGSGTGTAATDLIYTRG